MVFIVGVMYDQAITLTFYGYKDIILYFWKEILNQKYGWVNNNKVLVKEEIEIIRSNLIGHMN